MRKQIKKIISEHTIDLIHFDLLHLSRYARDVGKSPKVLTEHNVESLRVKRLAKNSRNPVFKIFMYAQYIKLLYFEKKACGQFDACVTVSSDDLRELKKLNPKALFKTIPNGVDTEYFMPKRGENDSKTLIWAGGMSDMYNKEAVEYFCKMIFPIIEQKVKSVRFIVIGKSPTETLTQIAKNNQNIKVLGFVDDIRPYMDSASIFVAPIKSGGGTKLKVLNALAMEKAVVTTSVGGEGIEAINAKDIIIADTHDEFAEKTIELLKNPELALKMGRNGRQLILEKYDWKIINEIQNELYENIVRLQK